MLFEKNQKLIPRVEELVLDLRSVFLLVFFAGEAVTLRQIFVKRFIQGRYQGHAGAGKHC